jgi:hypothetical protein
MFFVFIGHASTLNIPCATKHREKQGQKQSETKKSTSAEHSTTFTPVRHKVAEALNTHANFPEMPMSYLP